VTVADNSTTQFSAKATDTALNVSPCSNPIAYTEVTPPPALLAKGDGQPRCMVPKLAGKTLGQAKTALRGAGCTLGKVAMPKARKGKKLPPLVVKSSTPGAGASPGDGTVGLILGPKPKPKKHHR